MFLSSILFLLFVSCKISLANYTVVFHSGESGYFCVRIPSILTTSSGTLLAFGEGRLFNCNDDTAIDIVYKRSSDNGKTWSDLKILYRGNETNGTYTRLGNFAPIQLKLTERILVPFTKNVQLLMQTYSDDDGLTFSKPEIIPNVAKPEWKRFALGPPSGLLLQSNRLLVPGGYSTVGGSFFSTFVMLNDHNGQVDKWYLGGDISIDMYHSNEAQAVELLPTANSIFINSRSNSTFRIGSYSDDGGLTFKKIKLLNTLIEPPGGCEGSTIYHENTRQLFYTGLGVRTSARTNLSMYVSQDQGENWTFIKSVWPGPSAYSSLTTLKDDSIGVLFEAGTKGPYESLLFSII